MSLYLYSKLQNWNFYIKRKVIFNLSIVIFLKFKLDKSSFLGDIELDISEFNPEWRTKESSFRRLKQNLQKAYENTR